MRLGELISVVLPFALLLVFWIFLSRMGHTRRGREKIDATLVDIGDELRAVRRALEERRGSGR